MGGILLAGGDVEASCGDWLVDHSKSMTNQSETDKNAQSTQASEKAQQPAVPLSKRPCDGPGCRQAPLPPIAPPAPLNTVQVRNDGVLAHRLALLESGRKLRDWATAYEANAAALSGFPLRIDHPPQA